jgi:hypothetical protein
MKTMNTMLKNGTLRTIRGAAFCCELNDMRSSDPFSVVVPFNPPSLECESDSRELQ